MLADVLKIAITQTCLRIPQREVFILAVTFLGTQAGSGVTRMRCDAKSSLPGQSTEPVREPRRNNLLVELGGPGPGAIGVT